MFWPACICTTECLTVTGGINPKNIRVLPLTSQSLRHTVCQAARLHLRNCSWLLWSHVTSRGTVSIWQGRRGRGGQSEIWDTHTARWCVVRPLSVLIILSLGVKEEWRGEVVAVVVETGWLTQHPLWTGNRWDLTPSTQITAKEALACSHDHFKMTTAVYSNKRRVQGWGSGGNMEILQSSGGEISVKLTLAGEYLLTFHFRSNLNYNLPHFLCKEI